MQHLRKTCQLSLKSLLYQSLLSYNSCKCLHAGVIGQLKPASSRHSGGPTAGCRPSTFSPLWCQSHCCSLVTLEEAQGQVDTLNDLFVAARDEIEYAQEDAETTYFNESHKVAKEAVGDVTAKYREVLGQLSEADRGKLQRSMGMKMEQLKAELGQLDTLHT